MSDIPTTPKLPVRHSDFMRGVKQENPIHFKADILRAVDIISGGKDKPHDLDIELGTRVAALALADRSQRNSHHMRYRHMVGIPDEENIIEDGVDGSAEESLLAFQRHTTEQGTLPMGSVWLEDGKGLSVELGHVEQMGSWPMGRMLDEEIRSLPHSQRLQEAGFVFADTYGAKDAAKISYSFRVVDDEFTKSPSLMAIRKRAAADIQTTSGDSYEIIKRSSFLIDVLRADDSQQPLITDILRSLRKDNEFGEGEKAPAMAAAQSAGEALVEPFIVEKSLRERSKIVLAVSSIYFALKRY